MKRFTDIIIAKELNETSSSLSHLKKRHPNKYEIIRLGSYIYKENIKEAELLNLLETYRNMKKQVNKIENQL